MSEVMSQVSGRSNMAAHYKMAGKLPQLVRSAWRCFREFSHIFYDEINEVVDCKFVTRVFQLYPRITCGIKPKNRTDRSKKLTSTENLGGPERTLHPAISH